jgi:adenylate cyclase
VRLAFSLPGAIRPDATASERGAELVRHFRSRFFFGVAAANLIGAMVVFVFLAFVVPAPAEIEGDWAAFRLNLLAFAGYMLVAIPLGIRWARSRAAPILRWLSEDRAPTANERDLALRLPLRGWTVMGTLWGAAALLFAVLNAPSSLGFAAIQGFTIALGGLTTCALVILWVERMMREVIALALESGVPNEPVGPGVGARMVLAWALGTGIPLLGVALLSVAVVLGTDISAERLATTGLFLAALGLTVGLLAAWIAGRSVADPVEDVRGALGEVERGNLQAQAPVSDGSEVGLLAAGFNRMAAGLRERERLREAFGAFVDPGLAERVLREGTDLAGEEVEVSILFMDIRAFTTYSEGASAREVVSLLNELYEHVVPVVLSHGGHANKFIGDGLLAVFGAPERLEDHADRAVAAAIEIARLVRDHYRGELRIGIGVNSGRVMAGTIGGGGRLDFTVIGDAVNTAARVESATRQTDDDVLVSEATRSRLSREFGGFEERPAIALKGKAERVRLYAPLAAVPAA